VRARGRFGERLRRHDAIGHDHRGGMRLEQALDVAGDGAGLVGADDLDAVGMREVEVPDDRGSLRRLTPYRRAAFAPGYPGKRQRLAVIVMQPRDVDLQHPAAKR
jgi:hypothetical protein